jgi:hypothetical protein
MEYFAGLDVSMEETHVIIVDRDGKVILASLQASLRAVGEVTVTQANWVQRSASLALSENDGGMTTVAFALCGILLNSNLKLSMLGYTDGRLLR